MKRKTIKDFAPEVLALFDNYVHGAIDRRGFLEGAARFAVGGVTAGMLLEALNPKFAQAQQVKPDEPQLKTEYVEFTTRGGYGKMRGYLARPAKVGGPLPAVIVVHENRGLNPHIEDIARRLALDNFVAFAPDALTPLGGYPGEEDQARGLFARLDQARTREDFVAAAPVLQALSADGIRLNVTAIMTSADACRAIVALRGTGHIISILAGRIADTGRDPEVIVRDAVRLAETSGQRILWASTREVFNVVQAERSGADIITMTPDMIDKMIKFDGYNLENYTLDTVRQFARDAEGMTL